MNNIKVLFITVLLKHLFYRNDVFNHVESLQFAIFFIANLTKIHATLRCDG